MTTEDPESKAHSGPRRKTSSTSIERAETEHRAIELRRAGHTFDQIADKLGLPNRGVAHRYVTRGLARWMRPAADELRAEELDRTDALIARLWPLVDRDSPKLTAVDRLLRVLDYRAKIAGLYAPVRQEVDVDVRAEVVSRKIEAVQVLEAIAREALGEAESDDDDE